MVTGSQPPRRAGLPAVAYGAQPFGLLMMALAVTVTACSSAASHQPQQSSSSRSPGHTAWAQPAPSGVTGAMPSCPKTGAVEVSTADELTNALQNARPGQSIVLRPGVYRGDFTATTSGTATAPITLCGSRSAVLQGDSIDKGYVLHMDGASWWRLLGFTVEGGQKGVVTDGVTHVLIDGLFVHTIGEEGIHLRSFTTDTVVTKCVVRQTGLLESFFGEGLYVGSAHKNWCRYTRCQPDASNNDVLSYNDISETTAENIDIKEGTTGGAIIGNRFDGAAMVASASKGWVNVKGNSWTIENNMGVNSIDNGFEVHQVYPGWGIGNIFKGNHARVNGPGYGIYVQSKRLQTVVECSNKVAGAGAGFSTVGCATP